MAQESLLIYFVHLCIVYGSIWNVGLQSFFGGMLRLMPAMLFVVVMVGAMAALAWAWNWCKHAHGRVARLVSAAVFACLLLSLI
jgi:hypothetical protein